MVKKYLKKLDIPKEYLGKIKIAYVAKTLKIYNYDDILSIDKNIIELKNIIISGNNLSISYIDKIFIELTGEITKIEKREK